MLFLLFFFFSSRRRHTRFKCDWSSDVCSSDLGSILATSLGFVVVQLDGSILNVALVQIGISLGTSVDGLQWTVDAYFLAFAVLLLSAGVLSDRLGARRAFVSGFAVFSAASLACALARSPPALICARVLQGGGAALLVPCSLALLNNAC